jgi:hypothetical protein
MKEEVQGAFAEMLDISTDIDRAILFSGADDVLASNMPEVVQAGAVEQAKNLVSLGDARAAEMGSHPVTQLVMEVPGGYVFLARELLPDGMTIMATGKKGSRVGLILYDLRTCMRDAREAMSASKAEVEGKKEA